MPPISAEEMHSPQTSPARYVIFGSCDKVYHIQEVRFSLRLTCDSSAILTRSDGHLTIKPLNHWIEITYVLL